MEEIKVGDWVRIAGGYIDQIQEIKLIHTDDGDQMGYKLKKDVVSFLYCKRLYYEIFKTYRRSVRSWRYSEWSFGY